MFIVKKNEEHRSCILKKIINIYTAIYEKFANLKCPRIAHWIEKKFIAKYNPNWVFKTKSDYIYIFTEKKSCCNGKIKLSWN